MLLLLILLLLLLLILLLLLLPQLSPRVTVRRYGAISIRMIVMCATKVSATRTFSMGVRSVLL